MFRVEHSRYYVAQFRASIPALRLGRLEGYQKYDQFVERRLGASYDFIDRLGTRYERASNALQTLYQNYLAVRANQTGKAIQQLTDRSYKTGEEIKLLQRFAEAALIGVLVPYYIVSSMGHLAADPSHSPPAAHSGPSVTQAFSVIFLSALPGIAIYRLQLKSKGVRYRLRNAALMVVVASIFWILIYNNPQVSDLTSPLWQEFQRLIEGVVADLT
jgi:uncharacterized membrane-anchored protein